MTKQRCVKLCKQEYTVVKLRVPYPSVFVTKDLAFVWEGPMSRASCRARNCNSFRNWFCRSFVLCPRIVRQGCLLPGGVRNSLTHVVCVNFALGRIRCRPVHRAGHSLLFGATCTRPLSHAMWLNLGTV